MLALGLLAVALLVVGLFARDWSWGPPGPGIMTKVKIFLTHFQARACGLLACCPRAPPRAGFVSPAGRPPARPPARRPCCPLPCCSLQMLSLFRDYDVVWPGATDSALGWFELANVGLSMVAPGG